MIFLQDFHPEIEEEEAAVEVLEAVAEALVAAEEVEVDVGAVADLVLVEAAEEVEVEVRLPTKSTRLEPRLSSIKI